MAGTVKFNPPPGWPPPPPGWKPPAGWRPDPSWPPPPAGWQYWVAEPRRSRGALVIALVAAATLALAIGYATVNGLRSGTDTTDAHIYGFAHFCVVTRGGGVECWGLNTWGQLGDGTTNDSRTPVRVMGLEGPATAVSANAGHSCAVTTSGAVWGWGRNDSGQLGNGTTTDSPVPVRVQGIDADLAVRGVTTGGAHTCAISVDGAVFCWGRNSDGQLGDGSTTNRLTAVRLQRFAADVVVGGVYHTCALTPPGAVQGWGNNGGGALGTGSAPTEDRNTPADVVGLDSDVVTITAGAEHTCAAKADGTVSCWGMNEHGQLGDGTTDVSGTPTTVAAAQPGVASLAAGEGHTCALATDGTLTCWGDNTAGQLGDGTNATRTVPAVVTGLPDGIITIAAVGQDTCAATTTGEQWCWGDNAYGQLGTGKTADSNVPVHVAGLH